MTQHSIVCYMNDPPWITPSCPYLCMDPLSHWLEARLSLWFVQWDTNRCDVSMVWIVTCTLGLTFMEPSLWRGSSQPCACPAALATFARHVSEAIRYSACLHGQLLSCVWLFVTHGLWPARLLHLWDFPGKNIGVGCHAFFQGIFPNQGLKSHLLHLLY